MNKLMIIGSLGRDPELRTTPNGIAVCAFSIAVPGRKKDDPPTWVRVTAWRQTAENCARYLSKGKKVAVVGAVSVNTYTAQDGTTRASLEVTAEDVEFLSPRTDGATMRTDMQDYAAQGFVPVDDSDDLPF